MRETDQMSSIVSHSRITSTLLTFRFVYLFFKQAHTKRPILLYQLTIDYNYKLIVNIFEKKITDKNRRKFKKNFVHFQDFIY